MSKRKSKPKSKSRSPSTSRTTRPPRRDYAALAAWADERFGPDKRWSELPLAAPVRGRPGKGRKPLGLKARTVKLPDAVWRELRAAAERHRVTVNGVLIALGQDLVRHRALDATIERLIGAQLLVPSKPR
jgi:hypothetical protein